MKDEDIRYGVLKAGVFRISVQSPTFDKRPASDVPHFEVLVSQLIHPKTQGQDPAPLTFYVHLVEDPRFNFFNTFGKFDRTIRMSEVEEYNAYVHVRHMTMPTWRLNRNTLREVVDLCHVLSKKILKP